ncbi:hypothetical protein [Chroococcidiopsis cubana]|nr:hypothetical protein [Chroococcidiopsis cubana]
MTSDQGPVNNPLQPTPYTPSSRTTHHAPRTTHHHYQLPTTTDN